MSQSDDLLLELDLPATTPARPVTAPAVSAGPALVTPLTQGRALLLAATDAATLLTAAHATTDMCKAAGIVDTTHPTRTALRGLYFTLLAWFCLLRNMDGLRLALAQRPELVQPLVLPTVAPTAAPAATFGDIVAESAANAAGQGAGSRAGGQLASVGYTSADGYVTALRNGVKQATATEYLATLRSRWGYTPAQIAGLTVQILSETANPHTQGPAQAYTHTPTGPDIFTREREAAVAAAKVIRETADATTLALAQRLVVADSPQAWWEIGWRGVGSITRAELITACGVAPEPKISSTQLARTMDSLRGTHDATMVTVRPTGVKVRWQIGRGQQHAAFVGSEYGRVLAIVDLNADNTLSFDGDATIADEVRDEYSRLCGDEVLRPGDVTAWLQQLLRKQFAAVRSGERYLLAPQHKGAARELCGKIASVWSVGGWVRGRLGDDGVPELGVTYQDVATVIGGIWQGLNTEVVEAEERWVKTVGDAAAKAAKPGVRASTNELERIDGNKPGEGLMARLGQLAIIGAGPLASLRARVVTLRAQVVAALHEANDPTSERFANLDLT
jgi:hypothetical protein